MAWTVDHPQRRHGWRYQEQAARVRIYRPLSVAGMAMLGLLVGAWAGIVAFVGPDFGFRPTTYSSWQWTTNNWLLHLIPGAVAVGAGLIVMASARASTAGARGLIRLAVLAMMAAGTWLVIGPALWPVFESSPPYGVASSARLSFAHQVGVNLGPGIILVALASMILEAVAVSRTPTVEKALGGGFGAAANTGSQAAVNEPQAAAAAPAGDAAATSAETKPADTKPADTKPAEESGTGGDRPAGDTVGGR